MDQLALKLLLTPLLIAGASLAGRRWGPTVSGWLIGIPFTSGPIAFFLALGHGPAFASTAAAATLAGTISQAAFCLAYSRAAARTRWPAALLAGALAFFALTGLLEAVRPPTLPLFALVLLTLLLALRATPAGPKLATPARPAPAWDLPARMLITTSLVLLLTASAARLGAHLTGLLAPFPLYGTILATFAHRQAGGAAARGVLRGLLFGLFGFASFFLALALLLGQVPLGWAFGAAAAAALASQAGTLWLLTGRAQRLPA